MSKPILLDLFCRMGGATVGYQRAGFHVIGVDIDPQPGYPGDEFVQDDVIDVLERVVAQTFWPHSAPALIHASPPCQEGSAPNRGSNKGKKEHPQLVPPTRELLNRIGLPYVIEQPADCAPDLIRKDLVLCMDSFKGTMPPPWVQKHRAFEISGFTVEQPKHVKHQGYVRGWRGRHGDTPGFFRDGPYVAGYGNGGGKATTEELRHAMGIDWMTERFDLCEAIPPAYTLYIGAEFRRSSGI